MLSKTQENAMIEALKGCKSVVFVTGAGISQASGIPTFRGTDGLWKNHDPMKLATIDAFYEDPKLVWEWYEDRRANIQSAKPNLGHDAIAGFEKYYKTSILTQNIDGLHQRAGSSDVLELHGSIVRVKCTVCEFMQKHTEKFSSLPPMCRCGNILRPDVVWFGEPLPQDIWNEAIMRSNQCDIMIIAGTSLVVSPANMLPTHARQGGAIMVEVNPEETVMSAQMDVSIRDTASNALPKILDIVKSLKD